MSALIAGRGRTQKAANSSPSDLRLLSPLVLALTLSKEAREQRYSREGGFLSSGPQPPVEGALFLGQDIF